MEKSPLFGLLRSYDSVKEVKEKGYSPDGWKEVAGVLGRGYPRPVVFVTVRMMEDAAHLGQKGQLTLTFFLNRLQKTCFRPADAAAYNKALLAKGTPLKPGEEIQLPPATVLRCSVESNAANEEKETYCWSDRRLDEEEKNWLKKN